MVAFRGLVDLLFRRMIPWPSLFGTDDKRLREEDVVNRRRAWSWRFWFRLGDLVVALIITIVWLFRGGSLVRHRAAAIGARRRRRARRSSRRSGSQIVFVFFLFIANFVIFMGPMLLMGISQIRGFEPGDAEWGVKLDDVRGQAEAKEEVRRIVTLWQSGEAFEKAGGKRERGLLFLGAPGTGKTMLAKAIATGFNSPFVSIPGSGFAQTFIGIDAIIVRFLARKAKKLARKWGGQCIVFIDEIDAVGMRRQALGSAAAADDDRHDARRLPLLRAVRRAQPERRPDRRDAAWRERLFEQRAPAPGRRSRRRSADRRDRQPGFPGGMMGGGQGQLALNQLLVAMDGIDNPPFLRRVLTNRINTLLDASTSSRAASASVSLRLPPPRPRGEQIYFIGATNVPLDALDPALTRPGRMGRHVWFRTPTKEDRKDIFDLYLGKVAHDPELDTPEAPRRDRAHHERLLAGDDRPGLLDGADQRAARGQASRSRWERPRRGDDDDRVGHRDRRRVRPEHETARGRDPRGRPRRDRARLPARARVEPALDPHARRLARPPPGVREGGALQPLAHEEMGDADPRSSARWPPSTSSTARTRTASAATCRARRGARRWMVGASGMGPRARSTSTARPSPTRRRSETRERIAKRFEKIGLQLMNRTSGGADARATRSPACSAIPTSARRPRRSSARPSSRAYNLVLANKPRIEHIADTLVEKRELYGDEVLHVLQESNIKVPEYDLLDEQSWPTL